jgi:hypothetical protein
VVKCITKRSKPRLVAQILRLVHAVLAGRTAGTRTAWKSRTGKQPLAKTTEVPKLIVPFRSIEGLSIQDACSAIVAAPKTPLREVRLFDFIMHEGKELIDGVHGLYFVFSPDRTTCLYVGKNSSPQFIERIPAHFAISEASWLNHFLKYYKKDRQLSSLFEAAKDAGDCHILLMLIRDDEILIAKAEWLSRFFQKPKFNSLASGRNFSRLSSIEPSTILGEAITNSL